MKNEPFGSKGHQKSGEMLFKKLDISILVFKFFS
jgi:hypothetical protein